MATTFLLFDGRARWGETDGAVVLVTADSVEEARRLSASFRDMDAVWFEYQRAGSVLFDGRMREDIGQLLLKAKAARANGTAG
jgi:hypothetical protein